MVGLKQFFVYRVGDSRNRSGQVSLIQLVGIPFRSGDSFAQNVPLLASLHLRLQGHGKFLGTISKWGCQTIFCLWDHGRKWCLIILRYENCPSNDYHREADCKIAFLNRDGHQTSLLFPKIPQNMFPLTYGQCRAVGVNNERRSMPYHHVNVTAISRREPFRLIWVAKKVNQGGSRKVNQILDTKNGLAYTRISK